MIRVSLQLPLDRKLPGILAALRAAAAPTRKQVSK